MDKSPFEKPQTETPAPQKPLEQEKVNHQIENIEIDNVEEIENFCTADMTFKSKREQLNAVREFLKSHLHNALDQKAQITDDVSKRIWDQETTKKLSQVIQDKYGVCLEWHVVASTLLSKLGVENVFKTGRVPNGPGHTYLDVKIDKKWEIFDPFAEKYLEDLGHNGNKFQNEYYKDSLSNLEQ